MILLYLNIIHIVHCLVVLVGKPEGRRPLGRPRRRWEDNNGHNELMQMIRTYEISYLKIMIGRKPTYTNWHHMWRSTGVVIWTMWSMSV